MNNRDLFNHAKQFLLGHIAKHFNNPEEILKGYTCIGKQFVTMSDIFHRLISSMSNRNMMPTVVNRQSKEDVVNELLFGFNPHKVVGFYEHDQQLFEKFQSNFQINNPNSPKNLWKLFTAGTLSGAKFLSKFSDIEDFEKFINHFSYNTYTKSALPMLLQKEIFGFGFALACDFLKELGYTDYPKPDIHLIDILYKTGVSNSRNDYEIYKDIIEMSNVVGETPYAVDKILRLIGSGNLYNHNITLGNQKDAFISMIISLGE